MSIYDLIRERPGECWKETSEFSGYFVSDYGRVFCSRSGKLVSGYLDGVGERKISFWSNDQILSMYVRNIVAPPIASSVLENMKISGASSKGHPKKIFAINDVTGKIVKFESTKDASEFFQADRSNISRCLNGRCKSVSGWRFEYANNEDYDDETIPLGSESERSDYLVKRYLLCFNLDTDEQLKFDSLSEAAYELGIDVSLISRIVKGERESTKGWTFSYSFE